ncbi:bifunctional 4-hydroxy-2-oxoglutarate aldolase/2-dehydro-3-deoxy-phosphogluconate aldolase [Streptococcus caviae]|uniref:bifunctional 4-hydroxy-2-oxoglutarate aldolase/2-dehydro-3-deoxy-phosphogluconate aldolase n=1 Tax=Streptococcus sp. 'caviae' TaxID=1915004 RepID=UPI0011562358
MTAQLLKNYFFAVIRGENEKAAIEIAKYSVLGGIKNIEITFSTPNADKVIKELTNYYKGDKQVIVGAGTVMNNRQAELADKAGAKFLVSPHCSEEIAAYAHEHNIEYTPGCATVTEVVKATKMGAKIIKLFPSETIGKNFIKAVHGPLPNVNLMPSGGVSIDNVRDWKEAGACAIGIGGALTKKVSEEGYQSVSRLARAFVEAAN